MLVMIDKKLFLEKIDEYQEITNRSNVLDRELQIMKYNEEKRIRVELATVLYSIFPKELTNVGYSYGFGNRKVINLELNLTDYLITTYKNRFPKGINRRFKHSLALKVDYNIEHSSYRISFWSEGMSNVIKDDNLQIATSELVDNLRKSIRITEGDINVISDILKECKRLFDSYDAYLLAVELERSK